MNHCIPHLRNIQTTTLCNTTQKTQPQALLQQWLKRLKSWRVNWRTRRQLAQMDDDLLKDIGVSRGEAEYESGKPFWRD